MTGAPWREAEVPEGVRVAVRALNTAAIDADELARAAERKRGGPALLQAAFDQQRSVFGGFEPTSVERDDDGLFVVHGSDAKGRPCVTRVRIAPEAPHAIRSQVTYVAAADGYTCRTAAAADYDACAGVEAATPTVAGEGRYFLARGAEFRAYIELLRITSIFERALATALLCAVGACSTPTARETVIAGAQRPPASGRSLTYPDLLPEQTVIPLVLHRDMPFVRVAIDRRDAGEFLVDTGTATNAIAEDVADRLGLAELTEAPLAGIHVQSTASVRKVAHLAIGGVDVAPDPIAVIDLDEVSRYTGISVAGIIGFPTLAQVPFAIDLHAATLTLYSPTRFAPPTVDATLLRVYRDQPYVSAICADGAEALLLLDTGASVPLVLWRPFVARVPDLVSPPKGWTTTFGAGGGTQVEASELRHLRLFGRDLDGIAVIVQAPPPTAWKHSRAAGIVGLPLLRDQRVTVDAASHRVWIERAGS
ncbi:MAG TPA: aspartyl protease family protein [Candidatus Binatia bacterium]|jgi:hypothetical protein